MQLNGAGGCCSRGDGASSWSDARNQSLDRIDGFLYNYLPEMRGTKAGHRRPPRSGKLCTSMYVVICKKCYVYRLVTHTYIHLWMCIVL